MTAQGAAPATAELRWRLAASFGDKPLLQQISGLLTTQAAIAACSAARQLMLAPRWQAKPPPERSTGEPPFVVAMADRKSTRLNSSHLGISYAVFCLKKK